MNSPAEIRAQAARLVMQVADHGRSLDVLLENRSDAPAERGLLRSLCYGSIRWYWRLYDLLSVLSSQPVKDLQPEVRALAIVGLYQLLHTDIAAHAAVAETVEAARHLEVPRAAGLLNAILRRCQREAETLQPRIDQDRATRTAHPRWLVEQLQQDWSADSTRLLEANNAHPPFWLRVNTRRISRTAYAQELANQGVVALPSPIAVDALWLPTPMDVSALPGFKEGLVSVQDAAAQLAAVLLDAQPGERVLDACAAPGGKTGHILERQAQLGELIAVDINNSRLRRVHSNLERLGLNATLCCGDAGKPDSWWNGELFDRILLDVPCSATGVIRRHPDIKLLRRAADIPRLAARQADLLTTLWPLLKTGGRLVYASCSLLKAENLDNISAFLEQQPDARAITAAIINTQPEAEAWRQLQPGRLDERGLVIHTGRGRVTTEATVTDDESASTQSGGFDGFFYSCLEKMA